MKTTGVNITTIAYLRVLIIEMRATITLMVVEAQGLQTATTWCTFHKKRHGTIFEIHLLYIYILKLTCLIQHNAAPYIRSE